MTKFWKAVGKGIKWITTFAAGLSLIGALLYTMWTGAGSLMTAFKDKKVAELEEKLKTANETIATLTENNGLLQRQVTVATTFINAVKALPTELILDKNQAHFESSGSAFVQLLEVNGNQAKVLLNQKYPATVEKEKLLPFSGVESACTITMIEAYTERQAAKLQIKCVPLRT